MSPNKAQFSGTTLRIDPDIRDAVRIKVAKEGTTLSRVLNVFLREWVDMPPEVSSKSGIDASFGGPKKEMTIEQNEKEKRSNLALPADLHLALKKACIARNIPMKAAIESAIRAWLENERADRCVDDQSMELL